MGRISNYSPEIAQEICTRISAGESLRKICSTTLEGKPREDDYFPPVPTVCEWVLDDRDGFAEQYARARRTQAELLADELFEIADEAPTMTQPDPDGGTSVRVDPGGVQRNRLRTDTRKWYLSKVLPKVYGDRQVVDLNVNESLAERLDSARKRSG